MPSPDHNLMRHVYFKSGSRRDPYYYYNGVLYDYNTDRELDVYDKTRGGVLIALDAKGRRNRFLPYPILPYVNELLERVPRRRTMTIAPGRYGPLKWNKKRRS